MSFIKGNILYTNKATKQEADQTDKPKRSPYQEQEQDLIEEPKAPTGLTCLIKTLIYAPLHPRSSAQARGVGELPFGYYKIERESHFINRDIYSYLINQYQAKKEKNDSRFPDSNSNAAKAMLSAQTEKKGLISNGIPQLQWIREQSQGWRIVIPNDIPEKQELSWQGRREELNQLS